MKKVNEHIHVFNIHCSTNVSKILHSEYNNHYTHYSCCYMSSVTRRLKCLLTSKASCPMRKRKKSESMFVFVFNYMQLLHT